MLHTVLMVIHFFCSAAIVALVLLQRGKGAEAGAGFGAGASGTVFGARGATTALSRATAILAAIFMITSLSLAYVGTRKSAVPTGSSLLDQPAAPTTPKPALPATPATPATKELPSAPAPTTATAPASPNAPASSSPSTTSSSGAQH